MKQYIKEIINQGDDSGNGMTVRFGLPSGLEIISMEMVPFGITFLLAPPYIWEPLMFLLSAFDALVLRILSDLDPIKLAWVSLWAMSSMPFS